MKKDPGLIFRIVLALGDALAVGTAFLFAYLFRINIDQRPYYFEANPEDFLSAIILLIPVWIILLLVIGLYSKKVILNHSHFSEILRLFVASILGTMALISYEYFTDKNILPTRTVALYAMLLCFIMLLIFRGIIHYVRSRFARKNRGTLRAVVIGNSVNTTRLLNHFMEFPEDGYTLAAVVANKSLVPDKFQKKRYSSLKEALARVSADVIFQTDEQGTEYVYGQAIKYHALYYYVPSESALSSHIGDLELIGGTPAIFVRITPLMGGARIAKRAMDIVFGLIGFILAAIPMAIIWLIIKFSDIHAPAIYSEYRLSRYNRKVKIYKFRSMKQEYCGMMPEQAFAKMGKPELIEPYRKNGDFLSNDPRITKIGKFIRKTSLDELPQLLNVIKGDIALVGPRALVPGELRDYGDRSLLLSVKSGLTGLAQVSGRRFISFDERRALDLYYVQNWSLWLDISIMFRTIGAVFSQKGAK